MYSIKLLIDHRVYLVPELKKSETKKVRMEESKKQDRMSTIIVNYSDKIMRK